MVNNFLFFSVLIFIFQIDDDEIFKSPRSSVQNVTPPQPSAANPKVNTIILLI